MKTIFHTSACCFFSGPQKRVYRVEARLCILLQRHRENTQEADSCGAGEKGRLGRQDGRGDGGNEAADEAWCWDDGGALQLA